MSYLSSTSPHSLFYFPHRLAGRPEAVTPNLLRLLRRQAVNAGPLLIFRRAEAVQCPCSSPTVARRRHCSAPVGKGLRRRYFSRTEVRSRSATARRALSRHRPCSSRTDAMSRRRHCSSPIGRGRPTHLHLPCRHEDACLDRPCYSRADVRSRCPCYSRLGTRSRLARRSFPRRRPYPARVSSKITRMVR
jgi:hypothetical protein